MDEDLRLTQLTELSSLYGLRDHTLFYLSPFPHALLFHLNEVFLFSFGYGIACLLKYLTITVPKRLRSPSYSNKNFSPIISRNRPFFIYSLNPFTLMQLDRTTNLRFVFSESLPQLPSPIHGGTRFIPFSEDELIGLFHTYTGTRTRVYKTFLLTLSSQYPFFPTRVSSKLLLDADLLIEDFPSSSPWLAPESKVIYERGIARLKSDFLISYGFQDRRSFILRASKEELDSRLDITLPAHTSNHNIEVI